MDAVAIGAILSVVISAVIFVVMIIKFVALVKNESPEDK